MPGQRQPESCVFCAIAAGEARASIVFQDTVTLAFMDLRQFHPGHVLVVPRLHIPDIRAVDDATAAALAITVARIARSVSLVFPNDGLSIWHAAGEGANQEISHLHFHVHPRQPGDKLLAIYPVAPALPERATLDAWTEKLRTALARDIGSSQPEMSLAVPRCQ